MKNILKMGLVSATFLFVLSGNIFAQKINTDPSRLTLAPTGEMPTPAKNIALRNIVEAPTTLRHRLLKIDADALRNDLISIELFDGSTVTFERKLDAEDQKSGAWNGEASGTLGSIVILPAPKGIYANIFVGRKVYEIGGIGNGLHVMTEIDQSQYPKENCHRIVPTSDHTRSMEQSAENRSLDNPVECNVRLLVAYTPAAATWVSTSAFGDMTTLAQAAVTRTNLSYTNSQVNFRAELALLVPVTLTESGDFEVDLPLFRNNGDGSMDEVFGLRDLYRADVCVLLTSGNGGCGLASDILATNATAFCALNADCAVGNLTFPHEIGHLQGARHDTYVDATNTPFAYGHGLVHLAGAWRTVMSYNDQCSDNGFDCTRLPFFSNPDVNNPADNVSTGTTGTNNNARVLNENNDEVRLFRTQAPDLALTNTTLTGDMFADQTATNTITAGNNYLVSASADVRFRAGSSIRLQPGFRATSGPSINSRFRATIETVANCPAATFTGDNPGGNEGGADKGIDEVLSLAIAPNLIADAGQIRYYLPEDGNVSLRICNLMGETIDFPLQNQIQEKGRHTLDWQSASTPTGRYYCILLANGKQIAKPFVVMK